MKRGKKFLVMILVLVILAGGLFAVQYLTQEEEQVEENKMFTVLEVQADTVDSLEWTFSGATVKLVRSGENWTYEEDPAFPLNQAYPVSMLKALANVQAFRKLEEVEELSAYGFDEPTLRIVLEGDSDVEILVGNASGTNSGYYMTMGDGEVYMIYGDMPGSFQVDLLTLVKREPVPEMTSISQIRLNTSEENAVIDYRENSGWAYSDSYVWFLSDGENHIALDTERINALVTDLQGLTLIRAVDYYADETDLLTFGFDENMVSIGFDYLDAESKHNSFELQIGKTVESMTYIKYGHSDVVYQVTSSSVSSLQSAKIKDLRPDELLLLDWTTVNGLDVTIGEESYSFQLETDSEGTTVFTMDGEEIDLSLMKNILTGIMATNYAYDVEPSGDASVIFTFHRNTETFSQLEIAFYPCDDTSSIFAMDGENRLLVTNSDVEYLIKSIYRVFETE